MTEPVQVYDGTGNENERFIYDRVSEWIARDPELTEADRPRLTVQGTAFMEHALQKGMTQSVWVKK